MHGFGSKKALLENFASSTLIDGAAVVVNGYLMSVNIKSVSTTTIDCIAFFQAILPSYYLKCSVSRTFKLGLNTIFKLSGCFHSS